MAVFPAQSMKRSVLAGLGAVVLVGASASFGQGAPDGETVAAPAPLELVRVDIHDRLYPDRWPEAVEPITISIPRGAPVTFQFAVRADKAGEARLSATCTAAGKARIHWLESVHVEGNTQGSKKNRAGGSVPRGWLNHLVREAPFDTLEALVEADTMPLIAERTHGVVVEFTPAANTEPGTYKGELRVSAGGKKVSVPFAFRVHKTALPDPLPIHSVHWLWPEPHYLTNGDVPEWWSERHWQLLEVAGRQLRRFGDDTMWTPLVNFEEPLIQVTRRKDGTYAFDYTRFDRWAELFLGLGFRHLAGGHTVKPPPGSLVFDEATGQKQPLLENPKDREAWFAFLPIFYDSLHAHLTEKGWVDNYIQHQYDEPRDVALYKRLTNLARKHLPGVKTIDALHNRATRFTSLTDIAVFSLLQLNRNQATAAKRNAAGKDVWLYHCTSPYPPNPNRHIDNHLTESRLYQWLAYKLGADGFLYWAANGYRGADEYKTSLGPFPGFANGTSPRYPGHPPGDNWFYYRSPEGLRPSIRIVSHREGQIDYALLKALETRNPVVAQQLVAKIAPSIRTFERDPAAYHQARTTMLEAFEQEVPETRAYWQLDDAAGAPARDVLGTNDLACLSGTRTVTRGPDPLPGPDAGPFADGTDPADNPYAVEQPVYQQSTAGVAFNMTSVSSFTFEGWFRAPAGQAAGDAINGVIGGNRGGKGNGFKGWVVWMHDGGKVAFLIQDPAGYESISSTADFDDGRFHHVAAVWDHDDGPKGTYSLYIDGKRIGSKPGKGLLNEGATKMTLGQRAAPDANPWPGSLDEFRFSPNALEPGEFLLAGEQE